MNTRSGMPGAEESQGITDRQVEHLGDVETAEPVVEYDASNLRPSHSAPQTVATLAMISQGRHRPPGAGPRLGRRPRNSR